MLIGKQCIKCLEKKPFEEFYRYFERKNSKWYYKSRCKKCTIKYITERKNRSK